ncbi:MAG: hypothetical protein L0Y43_09955, partial [Methylococcaceae bacterium]|nr:hypothetical protein [Methylococcaceae bacterium]
GMLLNERRLAELKDVVDTIAISLDGIPESHNRMRNSRTAFPKMAANLEKLRRSGIQFGFIFTLTQYNLDELDWVVNFALQQGAKSLQIHPLEGCGFANDNLAGDSPDRTESAYAYLICERWKEQLGDKLFIQIDFAKRKLFYPARYLRLFRSHNGQIPVSETTGCHGLRSYLPAHDRTSLREDIADR